MSRTDDPTNQDQDEDEVRDLLDMAGPRPTLPSADFDRIRAAARDEWQRGLDVDGAVERSGRTPATRWLALAAVLLLALASVALWRQWMEPKAESTLIAQTLSNARVEQVHGAIESQAGSLSTGDRLPIDTVLRVSGEVPSDGCSIRLSMGHSLRLVPGTAFRLLDEARVELEEGSLYIDSGSSTESRTPVAIETPFGRIVEIGTQFEVALLGDESELRVRVREGAVSIDPVRGDGTAVEIERLDRGGEVTLDSSGIIAERTILPTDPAWTAWTALGPGIDLAPGTLATLLDWYSRERGLELDYSRGAKAIASQTEITWVEDHRPDDAELAGSLAPAVPELTFEIEDGRLLVAPAP